MAATGHGRPRRTLAALALLVGSLLAPASALAAQARTPIGVTGIGVKLIDPPVSSLTNPLARVYITGAVAAGDRMVAKVEVSNTTVRPQTISVYTAGARLQGRSFSFSDGRAQNELSRWTKIDRSRLRLAAGTATIVTVAVAVPRNATTGERYAVVWAAVRAHGRTSVDLVNRVGVRMYVAIGGAPAARYSISRPKVSRSAGGAPRIRATIHNTGTGTIAISGALTLTRGPGGMRIGPIPVTIARPLGPGSSRRVTLQLTDQLPRGPWHLELALASGSTTRQVRAIVKFPAMPPVRVHAAS
jgi:hypothetical protein